MHAVPPRLFSVSVTNPASVQAMHSLSEVAANRPASHAEQLRSAVALSTPPSPALPHGVNAVQAVISVANPVVPSHAVQQAALSSALLEISHAAPAQLPAAPTVASKPAPH